MEGMKGAASFRNPGKQLFLPPKSPFPNLAAPIYGGYGSAGFNGTPMQGEGYRHHQRTSSESFLFEEQQPSWLDDLLSEPETSARRGTHRRSSSDSFACIEGALVYANMDNSAQEECMAVRSIPLRGSQELDTLKDARNYYLEGSLFGESSFHRQKNRVWESAFNKVSLWDCHLTGMGVDICIVEILRPGQVHAIMDLTPGVLFVVTFAFVIKKEKEEFGSILFLQRVGPGSVLRGPLVNSTSDEIYVALKDIGVAGLIQRLQRWCGRVMGSLEHSLSSLSVYGSLRADGQSVGETGACLMHCEAQCVDPEYKECPLGTYKNITGSDLSFCHQCPPEQLPHRAMYTSVRRCSRNSLSIQMYIERYHMPQCYTALEELIYTFGGPWLFGLLLFGLLVLLALVLSVARMKFVGNDELPGPAPTQHGSQIDHSVPILESLNEVLETNRAEKSQSHVYRMYEDAFNRFVDEINALAAYQWWEGSLHSILCILAYPFAWSWQQWRRRKKLQQLREFVGSGMIMHVYVLAVHVLFMKVLRWLQPLI
ncbi:hypothetical protein HPP92_024077 [Vanilla planifolia]|uniref:DUF8003 domain-containing protein n=1 Tax=Vanilla planifolia TaxID=51239 RepID=A0A835PMW0_VANPL|nr:hypothetical protein HPP92_024077 [Vanilla planifolia]